MKTIFTPAALGSLPLRNRFIRAGCFEGMAQNGRVTDALIEHHQQLAEGGIAMTTLGYLSVSEDGRGFGHELWARSEIASDLRRFTDAVHVHGARASVQLVHCGFFASPQVIGTRTIGASRKFCTFRMSFCRAMTEADIAQKIADFASAAQLARDTGFDAVEIHAGHGYLLSQFLSPWTNRRKDQYGGSLENRIRFPAAVIAAVRKHVGPEFPILVKMNQEDGFPGGLSIDDAVEVARAFEKAGTTALIPSCGFTARTPFMMLRGNVPVKEMAGNQSDLFMRLGLTLFGRLFVQTWPYAPLFLRPGAERIRDAVSIPVIYIGGVVSAAGAESLVTSGFPFVQLGRATVERADFVNALKAESISESTCDHCNRCVAAMDAGGVRCVTKSENQG